MMSKFGTMFRAKTTEEVDRDPVYKQAHRELTSLRASILSHDNFEPALPYELVEATEHHGPYICTSFGTTVCDFYAMSDPSSASGRNGGTSKPILFTDAAEHASYMVRAANAHDELMAGLRQILAASDGYNWRADVDKMEAIANDLLAKHGGQ